MKKRAPIYRAQLIASPIHVSPISDEGDAGDEITTAIMSEEFSNWVLAEDGETVISEE